MSVWWLSYAGEHGFNGGCLVEAPGFVTACLSASLNGGRPEKGGQVMGVEVPRALPPEAVLNRTYTEAEIEALWGAVRPFADDSPRASPSLTTPPWAARWY